MSPLVSVIVPNYNHAPFLRKRINSILEQTYQNFELILLDDCSTDNSQFILEEYRDKPHVSHIVFNKKNSGSPFAQWNKGFELATGEWVWIAESDDVADNRFLETLINESKSFPACGFAYSWTRRINSQGEVLHMYDKQDTNRRIVYSGSQFVIKKLLLNCSIDNVSECLFKKNILSPQVGGLYEDMHLCGDWFFYTLMAENTNVLEIQTTLSSYRMHETNVTSSAENKGLTFLEGVHILDYIVNKYKIPSKRYSKSYAKYWISNVMTYNISKSTEKKIRVAFAKNHRKIVLWHDLLLIKNKCKSLIRFTM